MTTADREPLATVRELAEKVNQGVGSPMAHRCREARAALADLLAALDSLDGSVEHREGVLEVYDWNGAYRGCIGVESWKKLLDGMVTLSREEAERISEFVAYFAKATGSKRSVELRALLAARIEAQSEATSPEQTPR